MIIDSAKVRLAMLRLGVGTVELSKTANLPDKTVSNCVNRDYRARVPTICKLARALKVEPHEIVKEEFI